MCWYSGGSDNTLNLWRVASCSSAPWIGAEDSAEGEDTDPPDVKVSLNSEEVVIYGLEQLLALHFRLISSS